ncbi:hypothetical protein KYB31_05460 [Clostridium felsineum]|uniref:hypothetical protein n=1 Tax=Clostridium felsineum TaxID=36839 RepID=UPI00214D8287|nr:hypothetical protein [Clostridium felsineum]MCR3758442.1 hypothetical protein [Clostridium felsineum]
MKNKEIDKVQKRINKLKQISNIVVLIGAALVTIFIKLNFMTLAIITAGITFAVAFGFDVVSKVLNFIINKVNNGKDKKL